jgi:hypothetical protein
MFGFGKSRNDDDTTVHSAATPKHCDDMGKKNGWKLVEARPNGSKVLPVDCVFEGKGKRFGNSTDRDYEDDD